MFRLIGLLSVFLLFGAIHANIFRNSNDVLKEADKAIAEVENKAKEFNQIAENIELQVQQLIDSFEQRAKPALDEFRNHLISSADFLDNAVNKLNLRFLKQTCGVLDIRENVLSAYDVAKQCTAKIINSVVEGVRNITEHSYEWLAQFEEIRTKIEQCKVLDIKEKDKKICIDEALKAANDIVTKFKEVSLSAESQISVFQMGDYFRTCLITDGTNIVMDKVDYAMSCLRDKMSHLPNVSEQILQMSEKFRENISNGMTTLSNTLYTFYEKLELQISQLNGILDNEYKKIKNVVINFGEVLISELSKAKQFFEHLLQNTMDYFCKHWNMFCN